MLIERLADKVIGIVTTGKYGVVTNPEFSAAMEKIKRERRNFSTKFYDSGTLIIIDDENHKVLTRLGVVRKR